MNPFFLLNILHKLHLSEEDAILCICATGGLQLASAVQSIQEIVDGRRIEVVGNGGKNL